MRGNTRKPRGFLSAALPWVVALAFALLAPLSEALAQTGTISGRVVDEQGNAVAGAEVVIDAIRKGALTNATGNYTIADVPAGSHTVRVRYIGYRPQTATVNVSAGADASQNFTLAVDPLSMEELVVTGTFTPRVKLESSVAVSTLTPEDLEQASPRSTTEMLRYVPGFTRVESSGGEVNQNISMRGILGVEYVMFMEDGLPVFPTMHTFFMNADNLFRPDENIERIEVVRGGSSALFGSNTPGAIINFINKTGGPELGGTLKATGGSGGLARYDFNLNGPLMEDWSFNVGGFYRYDHGVRDPGYPGIRGGQLKANITRLLDNGYLRFSAKYIDDRNQFILPLPHTNPSDPEYVPGFSDTGSFNTNEGLNVRVPIPTGELELPLSDGLRTKATWFTADVGFEFADGWSIRNSSQIMSNDQGWNAIVNAEIFQASDWVADRIADLESDLGITVDSSRLVYTNHLDAFGENINFNDETLNDLIAPSGEWHVEKPISAFQNQLQIQKALDRHNFSLGVYFANYTQTNRWFFTDILMDVRDNPRFVDLLAFSGPDTIEVTKNGFRNFLSNYVNGSGQTTVFSGVLGGELNLTERLRADIGLRYEFNDFVQSSENTESIDLDGNDTTTYDIEPWGNGSFRHFQQDLDDWAASIGLNYRVNDNIAVYALGSRAYKMPALDEFLNAESAAQVELFEARTTRTVEGGIKYSSERFGVTVNGFWAQLKNIIGQGAVVDTLTGRITWVVTTSPENRSYGAELEFSGTPTEGLDVLASGTILKAELGTGAGADIGSWINGVPELIGNLAVTYQIPESGLQLLGDVHYVGSRFSSFAAAPGEPRNELDAYTYANLGAGYRVPGLGVTISANVLNAFQSTGLEEGNPRVLGAVSELFFARPILPRRFTLAAQYDF